MLEYISITTFDDERLDIYARLSEKQLYRYNEPDLGLFVAESPKVITRALDAGYEPVSILVEDKTIKGETLEVIERCQVTTFVADFNILTQLTGFHLTRGLLCAMKRKPLISLETICEQAKRIAVLEDVENPTNVGAIVRSAAALNIDAVIFNRECSDPLYRRAVRVSMGTIFQVPWTFVCDDYMALLKQLGFKTVAMALSDDSISLDDERLKQERKLAIILGAEGEGLKDETIAQSDYVVRIPMTHGVDSLNVAAASAVTFWELRSREGDRS